MKKLVLTILLSVIAIFSLNAQRAWTLDKVPNTRLQSDYIHVSDPDGYLTDSVEMRINTALSAIRDSVDVFLVCLNNIGYEDPKDFASRLLNKWGVGEKGKDNGLMLLFVEDQHAFEFETGYGIEPILTDVKCFDIFQHTIKPHFVNGDYQGGMYAGVLDIVDVFGGTVPDGLITVLPDEAIYTTAIEERDKVTESAFYKMVWVFLYVLFPIFAFFRWLLSLKKDKKLKNIEIKDSYKTEEIDGVTYISEITNNWSGSAWKGKSSMRALTFGFSGFVWFMICGAVFPSLLEGEKELYINNWVAASSLIAYLSWGCWRHNHRTLKMADKLAAESIMPKKIYDLAKNYRRTKLLNFMAPWMGYFYKKDYDRRIANSPELRCPTCHHDTTFDADALLNEKQTFENTNDIRKYVSLRCPEGHAFCEIEKGNNFSKYKDCEKCGAHAMKLTDTKVIENATYNKTGLDEKTYVCQFCGDETKKQVVTPKRERPSTSGGSYVGGSSHGFSSSSRSSGGSFGGGRSGGGGYSGRW